MNKLRFSFLSYMLVVAAFLTTSCGNDDDPVAAKPSFVVSGTDDVSETTVAPKQEVSFTLTINAPGGFNTLNITKDGGTPETFMPVSRGATIENTYTYDFSYTPTMEEAGETIKFDFMAVDEAGNDNVYTYTIIVTDPEPMTYSQRLLYAPLGDGTSKTWFSTSTGETYTSQEVNTTQQAISNTIDFGYFYGQTSMATIASVADYPFADAGQANWTVKHATKVKKTTLTKSVFDEATSSATIRQAYETAEFGPNQGQATNLAVGDVLAFMTDPDGPGGSRYGMIYVETIAPGTTSTGYITIDVKVMPVL